MAAVSSSDQGESHNESGVSRDGKRGWKIALGKPGEAGKSLLLHFPQNSLPKPREESTFSRVVHD
jgi:hypothetical protein